MQTNDLTACLLVNISPVTEGERSGIIYVVPKLCWGGKRERRYGQYAGYANHPTHNKQKTTTTGKTGEKQEGEQNSLRRLHI